jgi:Flp pilus assembly pilin Flp
MKSEMRVLVRRLLRDDKGQDLVEWVLLLGLASIGATALLSQSGHSVSGIVNSANQTLQVASTSSSISGTGSGTGTGNSTGSGSGTTTGTHHNGGGGWTGSWGSGDHHHRH